MPSDYTFDVPPAVALMRDKHLHDKNKHVKRKVTKCCNKHFTLESRQRFILDNSVTGSQCPVMRVDISDLEPDSRYVLRAYSEQWRYAPVEVQTLSSDTLEALASSQPAFLLQKQRRSFIILLKPRPRRC